MTLGQPVAANLLARDFKPEKPNQVWSSDLTYIPTKEGWLYLAVTLDLYARCVVGWAMEATMPAELPLRALQMAIDTRNPARGWCITVIGAVRVDSTGRRNTSTKEEL